MKENVSHGRYLRAGGLIAAAVLALAAAVSTGDIKHWWEWTVLAASLGLLVAGVIVALGKVDPLVYTLMMLASLPTFVFGVVLHNVISAISGVEEPVFFLIALLGAPLLLVAGLAGLLRAVGRDLWMHLRDRQRQREGAAPRSS